MIPGEILFADGPVVLNEGREVTRIAVINAADRPVQVGSHYHFAEANPGLDFDRAAARGKRLNIAAGTAVRFEPGIPLDVELVPLAGLRVVPGLRGETGGALDVSDAREAAGSLGALPASPGAPPPTPKAVGETAKAAPLRRAGGDGGTPPGSSPVASHGRYPQGTPTQASALGENGVEGA